ncbi:MAG TPA: HD domain-containing phosphohydrolase [Pyrinomonadaceae bacterium]|nr:HD domain-containing phosphohydrolase [Pyrinomonadaceae bacterium]
MAYKIMIVDDEPANLRLLERLFRRNYKVIPASSGEEALKLLNQHDIALLITDQRMPAMTGIELLKRTVSLRPHMVRIILTGYTDVSALVEAINCGHVYKYVAKPWDNQELRLTVERALEHYETNRSRHELEQANKRLSSRLQEMTGGMVRAIADALEAKDEFVYNHARRVSNYASAIARRMDLNAEAVEQISLAAFLHDIGKIGTPDSLLLKPTDFTEEEQNLVKLHPERGARILSGLPDMADIANAIRYHHENYDGSGYPEGLRAEQIPLISRIIRVADAYDTMTSPRAFSEAYDHDAALNQLMLDTSRLFDPAVVRAFLKLESLTIIRRSIAQGHWGLYISPAFSSDNPSFADFVQQVKLDPVLAAHVLREMNLRGGEARELIDLERACTYFSQEQIQMIAAQNRVTHWENPELDDLREHSHACARAARLLAEHTRAIEPQTAYALGLLHDIGEVLLRSAFPEEVESISPLPEEMRIEQEVATFGVDHAQIGEWILESCGIPRSLTALVQSHHDAMRINSPAALLLYVANVIACAKEPEEMRALDSLGSDRLAMLGLGRSDLVRIRQEMTEATEQSFASVV